jgi:hypothetical protein
MKAHRLFRGAICLLFCVGAVGCVQTTSVKDSPRAAVTFETAAGAQIFYEAYLSKNYGRSGKGNLIVYVDIPLPYWHKEVKTDNVLFNDAISAADTNHDGIISDDEARAYSAKVHPNAPRSAPVVAAKAS